VYSQAVATHVNSHNKAAHGDRIKEQEA